MVTEWDLHVSHWTWSSACNLELSTGDIALREPSMPSVKEGRGRDGSSIFPSANNSTGSGWGQLSELTSAYSHWLWTEDLTIPKIEQKD